MSETDFPIAIIGTGFAGIGAAVRLKHAGIESFTLFERADEIGGTWRDNTYPGAACDVPSHAYSLSFEPNPDWTRKFSPSWEIHQYLLGIVEKWGLREHLRLGTGIVGARFDEPAGTWTLTTDAGDTFTARVVVSCVGGLVDPKLPNIPGIEDFAGRLFHTARWDHQYDLAGKRVAVIGTGASAVQVVPSIAPEVGRLSVFQRTPAWVVPRLDEAYSERARRLYARFPWLLKLSRLLLYWTSEIRGPMIFLDSKRLSAIGERWSSGFLEEQVGDPALREKLRPRFQFGCKRILISDDYWSTFERENVDVVTDRIAAVRADGIETEDGKHHPLDAIVMATGFDVGLGAAPFPIVGRGGRSLDDTWGNGAIAYKGLCVHGFPNWFILMGPNTGPGHTSVLIYTEAQIEHVLRAIRRIRKDSLRYVEIREDAQERYYSGIQGRMKYMAWGTGCAPWYLASDGSNHTLYPGLAGEYALRTRRFHARDYELTAA